jgi:hypothetical protein
MRAVLSLVRPICYIYRLFTPLCVCVCVCVFFFFNILVQTPTSVLVSTHCSMQWVQVPVPVLKRSEHEVDQRPSASDKVKNVSGVYKYKDLVLQVGSWVISWQPSETWRTEGQGLVPGFCTMYHTSSFQQLCIISINLHLCPLCSQNSSALYGNCAQIPVLLCK